MSYSRTRQVRSTWPPFVMTENSGVKKKKTQRKSDLKSSKSVLLLTTNGIFFPPASQRGNPSRCCVCRVSSRLASEFPPEKKTRSGALRRGGKIQPHPQRREAQVAAAAFRTTSSSLPGVVTGPPQGWGWWSGGIGGCVS